MAKGSRNKAVVIGYVCGLLSKGALQKYFRRTVCFLCQYIWEVTETSRREMSEGLWVMRRPGGLSMKRREDWQSQTSLGLARDCTRRNLRAL